jgi:hypothetical protein
MSKARLFDIYHGMLNRCLNASSSNYSDWGGRGISVCDEWRSFENFHKWAIDNGYADTLKLDRVDNDGGYSPENCRWTNQKEQSRNTRRNIYCRCRNKLMTGAEAAERENLPYFAVYAYLTRGICKYVATHEIERPLITAVEYKAFSPRYPPYDTS